MTQKKNGKDKSHKPLFSAEEDRLLKSFLVQTLPIVNLPVSALNIDESYNDRPRERMIQQIALHFSVALLGVLLVGQRSDGVHWVVDGASRTKGIKHRGENQRVVPCQVFQSEGQKQEAFLFSWFADKRSKTLIPLANKLNALGVAGVDRGFKKLIEQCGFSIPKVQGVGYYLQAYNLDDDGAALQKALYSIKAEWRDRHKLPGYMVLGVALVYRRYAPKAIDEQVRRILRNKTPDKLWETAVGRHIKTGGKTPRIHPEEKPAYIARVIVDAINRNPGKAGKLDLGKLDDSRVGA